MSRVLEFSGRSKLDKVTHKGTGVNLIDGELWLINGDEVLCPIEETSLRIRRSYQYEKFECSAKAKTLGYKCEYSFIIGCVLEKPNGKKMLLEQLRDFDN